MKIYVKIRDAEITLDDGVKDSSMSRISALDMAVAAIESIVKTLKEHEREEIRSQ